MSNTIEIATLNKNCSIVNKFEKKKRSKVQNCDNAAFMDIIKGFPCIYDCSRKHFKGRNIQANVLKKIPEILHI